MKMTPQQLIWALEEEGIRLQVNGDRLAVSGPRPLQPDERESLVEFKGEVLRILGKQRILEPPDELGWQKLREIGAKLGSVVRTRGQAVQIWGITPRGVICFDGRSLKTVDLKGFTSD